MATPNYQYEPLTPPSSWNAEERRLLQRLTDILDDIYMKWGRLDEKHLAPSYTMRVSQSISTAASAAASAQGTADDNASDIAGLTTRVNEAELKITPTAITSTVRSSTEYVADQGALQDGIDGVADDLATETTNRESAITQLSDLIDLRVIKGELETYLRLIEAGVQIGKSNSPYNVLIDDDSVDIVQSGVTIATFAFNKLWTKAAEVDNYVKIGGATLEWSDTTGFSLDV